MNEAGKGVDLYSLPKLPPGMIICISAASVARLINRSRLTIWRYIRSCRLAGFRVESSTMISLADIGCLMRLTETQVYNVGLTHRLPICWIYQEEGGQVDEG